MPLMPTILPTGTIQFPDIPNIVLPTATKYVTKKTVRTGPGGLPIETDLGTLNQLRSEINTAVNINPNAVFQNKIPAEPEQFHGTILPPLPVNIYTMPQNIPQPTQTNQTQVQPVLPTPVFPAPVLPPPVLNLPQQPVLPTGIPVTPLPTAPPIQFRTVNLPNTERVSDCTY